MVNTDSIVNGVEKLKIAPMVRLPAKVAPGSRAQAKLPIATNVWEVILSRNLPVFRYDFRVLEEYPPKKEGAEPGLKEVTKQTRNDYLSIDRKNKCVTIFKRLLQRERKFFGTMSSLVYDRASILYSLDKLRIGQEEVIQFAIKPSEVSAGLFSSECVVIHVNIKCCVEDFELTLGDFKSGISNIPDNINRSVLQFYELLFSQEAFFSDGQFISYGTGDCFLMDPFQFGFRPQDTPELPDGKYIGVGASKACKIIEGQNNGTNMSVHVDVKKAAFHFDGQPLPEKVAAICGSRQVGDPVDDHHVKNLNKLLKGLYVRCTYGKNKEFGIAGITSQSAGTMKVKLGNRMAGLTEYFKQKYNISLQFTRMPLVIEKRPQGTNYYPMELLKVCENQRVTLNQQSNLQVQKMIRASATAPASRVEQMEKVVSALKLDNAGRDNRWMREMQMQLTNKNILVDARVLPKPTVCYMNATAPMKESTTWSCSPNMRYLVPAGCEKWCAVALLSPTDRTFRDDTMRMYVNCFVSRCRQRGMNMKDPINQLIIPRARESDVDRAFVEAERRDATFIHFVTSENLKFHGRMKLLESQKQILTQDLLTKNAAAAQHKTQTMDNIVHKTNLKLGGLNFELRLETRELHNWIGRGDRLIVGIDLAFSTIAKGSNKPRLPTVVGYSSNCRQHPLDFIGGYRYAWSEMEELCEGDETIKDLIVESLRNVRQHRQPPSHIIVLRDGLSEGQYKYVVEKEVEQIKRACVVAGGQKYRPHITVLVATKKHNLRLYRKMIPQNARVPEQNIPPGTVVDRQIVNPVLSEFYLNSHAALQGTAKTPRYNMVFDTSRMSSDEIQAVVYALTFNLQIVSQACSLPAPIMIADQMANRGKNNYNAKFGDSSGSTDAEANLEHLNAELGYVGKQLSEVRFNA